MTSAFNDQDFRVRAEVYDMTMPVVACSGNAAIAGQYAVVPQTAA